MKRIILDTNVYGRLLYEPDIVLKVAEHIPNDFIIYGTSVIRNEIRALSRQARLDGKSKRVLLLNIYGIYVKKDNHNLLITDIIDILAHDYFIEYKKQGGSLSLREMLNDFRIVACASVHHLDIVVSDDEKSMLSSNSVKAYAVINEKNQLKNPEFISFTSFKRDYL